MSLFKTYDPDLLNARNAVPADQLVRGGTAWSPGAPRRDRGLRHPSGDHAGAGHLLSRLQCARRTSTSAALIAALLIPVPTLAQAPGDRPIAGLSLETTQPIIAKVAAIDQANRTVTLVAPDGTTASRHVSSLVKNLGDVRVGDTVAVLYKEGLTFVASGPNAPTPPGEAKMEGLAMQASDVTLGAAAMAAPSAPSRCWTMSLKPSLRSSSLATSSRSMILRPSSPPSPSRREFHSTEVHHVTS